MTAAIPRPMQRIRDLLSFVYGADKAPELAASVAALIARYAGRIPARPGGWTQEDALLITYGDSILGRAAPLRTLRRFLADRVANLISFVHLLPFYPYSSDDGFAVEDFRAVRPDLGTWADIRGLAADYRLVFDGVVNHVSASSVYMKGYAAGNPAYADYFIALDPATDTSAVLRTRNLPLLHDYDTAAGKRWLWTTFSRDQVDLNFGNPQVLLEVLDVLLFYAEQGASMVRLDAIPYLWKQLGTACAHLPQTHALIKLFRAVYDAAAPHVLLLTETNVPHSENVAYFGERGDEAQTIYNFSLAPLVLWSMVKGNASVLAEWARGLDWIGPRATYLNVTATHDGIGMRPTEGILGESERRELVQLGRDHGGDVTGKRNADGSIAPYELNLNYFDAVNDPRLAEPVGTQLARFVVSQAIPMALMGMPGLYVHSLFGSRNDAAGVKRTGRARSINREPLWGGRLADELDDAHSLRSRVFAALTRLLRVRSGERAFHPDAAQTIVDLGPFVFAVRREAATGETILALHNVTGRAVRVTCGMPGYRDLLSNQAPVGSTFDLAPYQVAWLRA